MKPELPLTAKYLSSFDSRDYHEVCTPAAPDAAYAELRGLDLSRSRLVRVIFGVRTVPSLLRGQEWGAPSGPFLDRALELGWEILEEAPGRELAAGAVTQPWQPIVEFRGLPPGGFLAFDEPGFVKIVWGIAVQPAGTGSLMATETRTGATDEVARVKFRRYWLVLGLGIRLIRRVALGVVRRDLARRGGAASNRSQRAPGPDRGT